MLFIELSLVVIDSGLALYACQTVFFSSGRPISVVLRKYITISVHRTQIMDDRIQQPLDVYLDSGAQSETVESMISVILFIALSSDTSHVTEIVCNVY